MSVTEFTYHPGREILASLRQIAARIRTKAAQHTAYRDVYAELSALSDRELTDIGVGRGDIADIAERAAAAIH